MFVIQYKCREIGEIVWKEIKQREYEIGLKFLWLDNKVLYNELGFQFDKMELGGNATIFNNEFTEMNILNELKQKFGNDVSRVSLYFNQFGQLSGNGQITFENTPTSEVHMRMLFHEQTKNIEVEACGIQFFCWQKREYRNYDLRLQMRNESGIEELIDILLSEQSKQAKSDLNAKASTFVPKGYNNSFLEQYQSVQNINIQQYQQFTNQYSLQQTTQEIQYISQPYQFGQINLQAFEMNYNQYQPTETNQLFFHPFQLGLNQPQLILNDQTSSKIIETEQFNPQIFQPQQNQYQIADQDQTKSCVQQTELNHIDSSQQVKDHYNSILIDKIDKQTIEMEQTYLPFSQARSSNSQSNSIEQIPLQIVDPKLIQKQSDEITQSKHNLNFNQTKLENSQQQPEIINQNEIDQQNELREIIIQDNEAIDIPLQPDQVIQSSSQSSSSSSTSQINQSSNDPSNDSSSFNQHQQYSSTSSFPFKHQSPSSSLTSSITPTLTIHSSQYNSIIHSQSLSIIHSQSLSTLDTHSISHSAYSYSPVSVQSFHSHSISNSDQINHSSPDSLNSEQYFNQSNSIVRQISPFKYKHHNSSDSKLSNYHKSYSLDLTPTKTQLNSPQTILYVPSNQTTPSSINNRTKEFNAEINLTSPPIIARMNSQYKTNSNTQLNKQDNNKNEFPNDLPILKISKEQISPSTQNSQNQSFSFNSLHPTIKNSQIMNKTDQFINKSVPFQKQYPSNNKYSNQKDNMNDEEKEGMKKE